jgi:hypothetical protein
LSLKLVSMSPLLLASWSVFLAIHLDECTLDLVQCAQVSLEPPSENTNCQNYEGDAGRFDNRRPCLTDLSF